MGYIDLVDYYKLLFTLTHEYKYSIKDIYSMYPFERDVFVSMIAQHNKKRQELNSNG